MIDDKKIVIQFIVSVIINISLIVGGYIYHRYSTGTSADQITELEKRLDDSTNTITELEGQLEQSRATIEQSKGIVDNLATSIDDSKTDIDYCINTIGLVRQEIQELDKIYSNTTLDSSGN